MFAANGVVTRCGSLRSGVGYDVCCYCETLIWDCERLIWYCAMMVLGYSNLVVAGRVLSFSVLFHV